MTAPAQYRERLSPTIGARLAVLLLLPALILIGIPLGDAIGVPTVVIAAIAITGLVEWFLQASSPTVELVDGVLTAGRASIPAAMLGATTAYRGDEAFIARGRGLDPAAYNLLRPGIDPVLRIDVLDPQDPTPYWLVATRHPDELAAALAAAKTG